MTSGCAYARYGTMGAGANPEDHYSAQMESAEEWTVESQLADKPKAVVDLYRRFVRLMTACGPYTVSVTKTAIAFKGTHRGFAGAKPRKASLDGFSTYSEKYRTQGSYGCRPTRRASTSISFG